MKKIIPLVLLVLLASCANSVTEDQLALLNGYWEIEKVSFPDGQTKEYTINEAIDFIAIDSLKGYRKKMKPTFEGTYITNDDAELFTILKQENSYLMNYKTATNDWTETLNSVSATNFSVTNSENMTYTYKRYEPINITK
jgi:hypothetical protein